MKKLVLLAAVAVAGLSSCKKDYECCTSTTVLGTTTEACVTQKLTKSEAEDLEAASVEGVAEVTCEKQ